MNQGSPPEVDWSRLVVLDCHVVSASSSGLPVSMIFATPAPFDKPDEYRGIVFMDETDAKHYCKTYPEAVYLGKVAQFGSGFAVKIPK